MTNKQRIKISICTYQDGLFQVMIIDSETGEEIHLEGNREFSDKEHDFLQKVAPACVWTTYQQVYGITDDQD